MHEPKVIAEHLAHLVETSAEKRATGVVLGAALRLQYPHFRPEDYGTLNLKKFIETYASERIQVAGRAGLDVVYTMADTPHTGERSTEALPEGAEPPTTTEPHEKANTSSNLEVAPLASEHGPTRAVDSATTPLDAARPMWFPKEVWMAFSSVTNRGRILANRQTGEITVQDPSDSGIALHDPRWVVIAPLTRQDHIDMASEFGEFSGSVRDSS